MNTLPTAPLASPQTSCAELPQALQVALERSANANTVADAINAGIPSLAKLQRTTGEDTLFSALVLLLGSLAERMHFANGLNDANIIAIARRLTTDDDIVWWLNIADIDLLCRRIASGHYGNFYGHFSEIEFYDCLARYCSERTETHAIEGEKDTAPAPDQALLAEVNVGYRVGKDGNIVVPDEAKGRTLPPPLYRYDGKGRRVGENPAAWKNVKRATSPEVTPEELEKINRHNRKLERAFKIMDAQGVGYVEAVMIAQKHPRTKHLRKTKTL